jgi:hypothetical protein
MDEEKLAGDEQSGGPAMPLTTFVTTTFWAVAQEAVRRTARRIAHCSDYEDVISESMLALYQRWCTGGGHQRRQGLRIAGGEVGRPQVA